MKKLSIFQKIWFSVGILVLGCLVSMVFGYFSSMQVRNELDIINKFTMPASRQSLTAKFAFRDQVTFYTEGAKLSDPAKVESAQEKADEVQDILDTMSRLPTIDKESLETIKKLTADHKTYTEEAKIAYTALSKGDQSMKDKADALTAKGDAVKSVLETMNSNFTNSLQVSLSTFLRLGAEQQNLSMAIFLGVVIVSLIVMAIIIRRSIRLPLQRIAVAINEEAVNVADASQQVSNAGQALSDGASNQASAIEETSSSLTEMAAMIKQNALNAGETDSLMKKNTNEVLRQANEDMNRLAKSIEDISGASEATRRIIKTIDEIAFQTNLLALNAAVEAARAGEAGAGFAVVADEVRALAMRSAEAAKETTRLIDNTIQTVNQGKEYAVATQAAFGQNLELSNKATTLVSEIAAASNEQSSGIEQMNHAMSSIDQVVQEIAASAEETASASEELNAQSGSTKGIVEELVAMLGMNTDQMAAAAETEIETIEDRTEHPNNAKTPLLK